MKKYKGKYNVRSMRAPWHDYGADGIYFITIHTAGPSFYFGEVRNKKMILSDSGLISKKCWLEIPTHFPYARLGEFIIMPNHIHGIIKIQKEALKPKTANSIPPFRNPDSSANFPVQTRFIASHGTSQFIASADISESIASPDITESIASSDTSQSIASPDISESIASPDTSQSIASPDISQVASSDTSQSIASPDNYRLIPAPDAPHLIPPLPDTSHFTASQDIAQLIPPADKPKFIDSPSDKTVLKPGGFSEQKNPMINTNIPRVVRWFKGRTTWEIRKTDAGFAWHSGYYDYIVKGYREMRGIVYYIRNNPGQWIGE